MLLDSHFEDIQKYASVIETRLCDDCSLSNLKADNQRIIQGFTKTKENIVLINNNYEETINFLLC